MKLVRLGELPQEGVSHDPAILKRVMLRIGELGPVTQFAESRVPAGSIVPGHAHEDMGEVFLVTGGAGAFIIDGTEHRVEAGTCLAISPREHHLVRSDGPGDLVLLYFGVRM